MPTAYFILTVSGFGILGVVAGILLARFFGFPFLRQVGKVSVTEEEKESMLKTYSLLWRDVLDRVKRFREKYEEKLRSEGSIYLWASLSNYLKIEVDDLERGSTVEVFQFKRPHRVLDWIMKYDFSQLEKEEAGYLGRQLNLLREKLARRLYK
jgi:hypothetical protein